MSSTTTDLVNGARSSTAIKAPVKVATTANITLSGEQTIDGVSVVAGDRVLVKNQSTGADNGIYVCSTSTWSRAVDFDGDRDVRSGTRIIVNQGTAGSGIWYVSTSDPITIGTTSLTFTIAAANFNDFSAVSGNGLLVVTGTSTGVGRTLTAGSMIGVTNGSGVSGNPTVALDIDGGTAETAPAVGDEVAIYDLSALANRKMTLANVFKIINALTAETAPATDDVLAIYDTSEGAANAMTFANFLKVINSLTEDTTPDTANDFVVTYDASASAAKKAKLVNIVTAPPSAATQTQMEAASATTVYVSPGTQQYHPGHPKCWAFATVSGATPTLQTSYNITSITDTATGRMVVTIATDFSSVNWCPIVTVQTSAAANHVPACFIADGTVAAGTVELRCMDAAVAAGTAVPADPTSWSFVGYGDQA